MKTIDLLVQELPALGGWPDGAVEAGFLCSDDTLFFVNKDGDCPSGWRINMNHEVEDSWIEVTREQYEAALAAKNDGWIDWAGGECPLENGTKVDVKDRDGYKHLGEIIGYTNNVDNIFWQHGVCGYPDSEIIAYRLHKPQEVTDDETDMNECIGQDVAPVWSGEGLPPVGCECEYQYKVHGSEWCPLECVAVDGKAVFGWSNNTPVALRSNTHNFRPLRSEVDKKREEAIMSLAKSGGAAPFKYGEKLSDGQLLGSMWYELYDAIAAGKVRGVKLED